MKLNFRGEKDFKGEGIFRLAETGSGGIPASLLHAMRMSMLVATINT